MSAVAVPEPTKPGGVSVVGIAWNAPPFTLTCHTIGWSTLTKSANDPETSVHVIDVPFRSFADAEPTMRSAPARAAASTHARAMILDISQPSFVTGPEPGVDAGGARSPTVHPRRSPARKCRGPSTVDSARACARP